MEPSECFVAGEPYPFATKGELKWKEQMAACLPPPCMDGAERGVRLEFSLSSELRNGQPFDLDNLAEPVFSTLINRVGWFNRRRPNMRWWCASKRVAYPSGCRIMIESGQEPPLPTAVPLIDGNYSGPMPRNARAPELAQWAAEQRGRASSPLDSCQRWALSLEFINKRVNLGDVSTGLIKPFIDCLFPWFGGCAGAPHDEKIAALWVKRISELDSQERVSVKLWPASAIEAGVSC